MLPEIRVGWLYIGFMEWILLCIIVLIVLSFAFLISAPNPASSSSIGPIDESGAEKPVKRKTGFYEIVVFCYSCLLKPHRGDGNRNQQDALESFYNAQASIYDATRVRLLQGREDMLALAIAQIRQRLALGALTSKPVWVDIGGGTGFNIEQMQSYVDVPTFFEAVYLVDLSPSLCNVARHRFRRLGWKNVRILCEDARYFALAANQLKAGHPQGHQSANMSDLMKRSADLVTMSYSLSMIPEYYSVVDLMSTMLSPGGIIAVVDFYVQSETDFRSRNYIGGEINRHCTWISRVFWRTWFEADRVNLEAARRDYLEYRFGTVLSANSRCRIFGLRIPYYIWVGCSKDWTMSQVKSTEANAAITKSPYIMALDARREALNETYAIHMDGIKSNAYESVALNLSASLPLPPSWYQTQHWRVFYDNSLKKHTQFGDQYIYAFTWEDVRADLNILKIREDDVILAITSGGDNILAYALESPKRIHAVDLNPNQNHLLELKMACLAVLDYADIWKLFGEGRHSQFQKLLINKLSPHMSSLAFQYWLKHGSKVFSGQGLYCTGGSGLALGLLQRLSTFMGMRGHIARLASAETLNEQREIWQLGLRRVLLSRLLSWLVISNKRWLWKALGVPPAQRQLIEQDYHRYKNSLSPPPSTPRISPQGSEAIVSLQTGKDAPVSPQCTEELRSGSAIWSYAVQTFDPVIKHTLLSQSNHYYLLTLLGRYTRKCHPEYLSPHAHSALSRLGTLDRLRIHTDSICEVLDHMESGTLSIAVLMDSMDWFEPHGDGHAAAVHQVVLVHRALRPGGRVLLRSAGFRPWYLDIFEQNGFRSRRVNVRVPGECVDRVNMYASTWLLTKLNDRSEPETNVSPVLAAHVVSKSSTSSRSILTSPRSIPLGASAASHARTPAFEPLNIGLPAQNL